MPIVSATVDVTVNVDISDIDTTDLVAELSRRGIHIEEDDEDSHYDISSASDRDLTNEVRERGFLISKYGDLTDEDVDYLMGLIPSSTRPGSFEYFVYEKLRWITANAKI